MHLKDISSLVLLTAGFASYATAAAFDGALPARSIEARQNEKRDDGSVRNNGSRVSTINTSSTSNTSNTSSKISRRSPQNGNQDFQLVNIGGRLVLVPVNKNNGKSNRNQQNRQQQQQQQRQRQQQQQQQQQRQQQQRQQQQQQQNGGNKNGGNNNGGNNNGQNQNNGGQNNGQLALNPNVIQKASASTGQANGAEAGQAPSLTDGANFINFCQGKTLTNGLQVQSGSCNGIVMGEIPATNRMVSSIILNPQPGQDLPPNQDFNVQVAVANLEAGSFTNPQTTYYSAPQKLGRSGSIIGHTHVTIQAMQQINQRAPPDPSTFAFFKGINDAGDGQGTLQAKVAGGLPPGTYRVCTMSSSSNHQPVLMPVAQRGAQDDCTKFTIGQGNGGQQQQGGNNQQQGGNQNGGNRQQQGGQKQQQQGGNRNGGRNRNGRRELSFSA